MNHWKFTPTGNHLINALLLLLAAGMIVYNHYVLNPGTPLPVEAFAPLMPGIGQWVTSLAAHRSASSKFINAQQVFLIFELAKEKGADPYEVAEDECGVELKKLTRKQANQVITALKKRTRVQP